MISSEITFDLLWSKLGSTSVYAALVPIVLGGGLAIFKPWVSTEDEIRNRINLRIEALRESVNKLLHNLLKKVLDLDPNNLRPPPPEADFIAGYTAEVFRVLKVLQCLDTINKRISNAYTYLWYTVVFGIASVLLVLLAESTRPYIALLCYAVIISQVYTVRLMRKHTKQLENYEKTT